MSSGYYIIESHNLSRPLSEVPCLTTAVGGPVRLTHPERETINRHVAGNERKAKKRYKTLETSAFSV